VATGLLLLLLAGALYRFVGWIAGLAVAVVVLATFATDAASTGRHAGGSMSGLASRGVTA